MKRPASEAPNILEQMYRVTFLRIVTGASDSIQFGSLLTGSRGQPVASGQLKGSVQTEIDETGLRATIGVGQGLPYARSIEDGIDGRTGRPLTLRSEVGGFHSVALTVAGMPNIIAAAVGETRRDFDG